MVARMRNKKFRAEDIEILETETQFRAKNSIKKRGKK
jgi:hypothetical protein